MSQIFPIHPENPQHRLLVKAANIIRAGGVVVYPTDSGYALGCHIGDKNALTRIRRIRQLSDRHNFTLICRDLSEISTYAIIDNSTFRLLKAYTPGPYTYLLRATDDVPRRLRHPKRKTIGLRIPDHVVAQQLLECMGEPLMTTTLILPGELLPLSDVSDIEDKIGNQVDLIIDSGFCGVEPTTVIDLVDGAPQIIREGKGDVQPFVE